MLSEGPLATLRGALVSQCLPLRPPRPPRRRGPYAQGDSCQEDRQAAALKAKTVVTKANNDETSEGGDARPRDGHADADLVAARLRHIAAIKWGTRRYLTAELLQASKPQQSAAKKLRPRLHRSESAKHSGHNRPYPRSPSSRDVRSRSHPTLGVHGTTESICPGGPRATMRSQVPTGGKSGRITPWSASFAKSDVVRGSSGPFRTANLR